MLKSVSRHGEASMGEQRQGEDAVRLGTFERRNRESGNVEEIRLEISEFNGRPLISARVWYRRRPTGHDDDGWRPGKNGFTIREHEIGPWVHGLEQARSMLADRPGRRHREDRQQPATRPTTRPQGTRPTPPLSRGGSTLADFD
jgi:hypothetical protein